MFLSDTNFSDYFGALPYTLGMFLSILFVFHNNSALPYTLGMFLMLRMANYEKVPLPYTLGMFPDCILVDGSQF